MIRPVRHPFPSIRRSSSVVIVPEKVWPMSGTKTLPRHTPFFSGTKSRNRIRPTRSFVPPRRASALALSLAQTTTPHILLPHGWARTCTLSCGFFHTPKEARCASTDADAASSSMAANTKLNLIAILPQGRIIICATFSAIAMVGALVLPDTIDGMIDASTTRKPSMPRTRAAGSTTDAESLPMRHVPTG